MPLSRAVDLHTRRIDNHMTGFLSTPDGKVHIQRRLAPTHRAVVRHREVEFHEPEHRPQEALGSPKAQMKDRLQDERTFDRGVSIDFWSAPSAILFRVVVSFR
jgi:hypothetical protein